MLRRLGDLMYRRARLVLLVTGILLAVAAVIGVGAFGKLQGGGFDDANSPSTKAANQIDAHFGGEDNLILLVRAQHGTVDSPDVQSAGLRLTGSLEARSATIDRVTSYWKTPAQALRS